ncbi:MAG: hypothetical protein RBU21_15515 [FCB group bacterium]|jgi:hypothetical protein|nr:hypothetical protein [FCB group bacterium]
MRAMSGVVVGLLMLVMTGAWGVSIEVNADRATIGMGRTVIVDAVVKDDGGRPLVDCQVLTYVNERRWGSHERTDADGHARFWLPLPNPGPAEIKVRALPETAGPKSAWIWGQEPASARQDVFLQKQFELDGFPASGTFWVAVDDSCEVFLNGEPLGKTQSLLKTTVYGGLETRLRSGVNTLSVKANNYEGPGGLLARLDWKSDKQSGACRSDETWRAWSTAPTGWPGVAEGGDAVTVVGGANEPSAWPVLLRGWPEVTDKETLLAGRLLDEGAVVSEPVRVTVTRRSIAPHAPSDTLFIMQWESWFTPRNAYWQTAQAVPVVGFYDSYNRDVMRQHVLWFADAGIDCILSDWSNHIWGKQHWSERGPATNEIIHGTTLMLETLAEMKAEGIPVPKVAIMPGLSNGPPTTMVAMNEQLDWIYQNYVNNPRFEGLMQDFDGKPLVVILDCGTIASKEPVPADDRFTVRYMGTQLQITRVEEKGYWSWMDGSLRPVVTYKDGKAEATTITPAYFAEFGWIGAKARGRMGGTTYLESFKAAYDTRPRVVFLHQWNEYAGQLEGKGYGPNHDIYVDSYSPEFSDDIEPVSPTAAAYRGNGGWGYYYHNLTRALMDVLRGASGDTLLAVSAPAPAATVKDLPLVVEWASVGPAPQGFRVLLDGRVLAEGLTGTSFSATLEGVPDGPHTLTVDAPGATSRYALSHEREDEVGAPQPVAVNVPFNLEREK